ncbi:cation-translocating P-type ATPase [Clostridium sp. BNL1100]|uniref:cation-translocating P-type ATPase n=1 Tax=Clostridium sp. BNL1100 TaxID=755731 RepID=UPI00024A7BA9|nr:cation-translocating P-type ATPase [Clostridium sp. BNL1100]AEY66184.1 cation transport ATPase [Clostridium sp. BNL1100]
MSKFFGFKGDYSGLTDNQATENQIKYGMNELNSEKKKNLFIRILGVFKEPMFLLLFCTAIIYFFLGEARDGVIMICFVTFMTGISFIQEWRTDKTLEALKELASPRIRVVRASRITSIESREITINDLMILEEGEKIPADARIIEMFDFGVDESSLTGESEIVWKKAYGDSNENNKNSEDFWRKDVCYAGTTVIQGSAIAKVFSIGKDTQYGKIGTDILGVPERPTPLEKQTRNLVKICALIGLCLFILVSVITLIHTGSIVDSILSGITLAMAMIPEEFPVVLTVFLAMGAWRLAKKNSLVRKMPSVETLGSVSVLCVDKTGTLTKNQMSVKEACPFNGFDDYELAYWAALACEIEPYDPMEKALLKYIESHGAHKEDIFKNPLLYEYSFSSDTKMMGHVWSINNSATLAAKGSPESVLPLCCLTEEDMNNVAKRQKMLATEGYRVIAVARSTDMKEYPDTLKECKLDFVGLIGLQDPPRDEVMESIDVCKSAGLRVIMITGDNGITAQSIAREIGINHSNNVITGQELEIMQDEVLLEKVKNTNIFARVMPRHKMRIVKALRDNGEIVAMTGDGVNDAPALKYADIGIAMGKRGTGVAKEASDMILLDDNFSTIVESVGDGRRIYDNIRKAIGYILVIHIPIALIALLAPLLHMPLVLLPVNVVLLELIIDPTCSIVFERLPAEKDIMHRKPRSNNEPLITGSLILKSIFQGIMIFAAAFGSYTYFYKSGAGESQARTFALLVLGLSNLLFVYINQSDKEFAFRNIVNFKDKVVITVNLIIIAVLIIITYVPPVNGIVQTAPLNAENFLLAIAISVLATMWWEIVKLIKRRN